MFIIYLHVFIFVANKFSVLINVTQTFLLYYEEYFGTACRKYIMFW